MFLLAKTSKSAKIQLLDQIQFLKVKVEIGNNCIIGSNTIIKNSIIGERVVIQDGCKLGKKDLVLYL